MADSRKFLEDLSRKLVDEGKLLEAGWISFRGAMMPLDTPAKQLHMMRFAYMAGCQHLFASLMTILEEGKEPTPTDLNRMQLINDEISDFVEKEIQPMPKKPSTLQ